MTARPDEVADPFPVPVIDLGAGDPEAVATEIDRAASEVGFLAVRNHGIDEATIAAAHAALESFFARPLAEKLEAAPDDPEVNRGYAAVGSESLSYSLGAEAPPDQFEAFNVGPRPDPDDPHHRRNRHHAFSPTPWPALEGFDEALRRYFTAAEALTRRLTTLFGIALGVGPGYFTPFTDHSTDVLRTIHYPSAPPVHPDGEPARGLGMGAHSDYGIVTVLWAHPVHGLEIVAPDGRWRPIRSESDTLLVNLGDLTARWTNDRWRSTLHRVQPPAPGQQRYSMAFFHDGNDDAMVECLPTCCSDGNPPRYPPVVAGEHLMAKLIAPRLHQPTTAQSTAGDRLDGAE